MDSNWLHKISPCPHIIGHAPARHGWVEPPRYIVDHELVLFSDGEICINIAGKDFVCRKDTYIIVPPNTVHASANRCRQRSHRHWIHFDWTFAGQMQDLHVWSFLPTKPQAVKIRYATKFVPPVLMQGNISSPRYVWELFERLCQRWNQGSGLDRLSCRGLLLELLTLLLGDGSVIADEKDSTVRLAGRIRQILISASELPIAEMPALPEVLGDIGRSYPHLCRVFRDVYGISPIEYVNAMRIERAKLLLYDTDLPVAQVATRVGFDNPAYFSRMFRKVTGNSPIQFSRR